MFKHPPHPKAQQANFEPVEGLENPTEVEQPAQKAGHSIQPKDNSRDTRTVTTPHTRDTDQPARHHNEVIGIDF
jgi:hypothetical protein